MADQAQRRIKAIGQQLEGGSSSSSSSSSAPALKPINKVAQGSSSLRVKDKVIIITGESHSLPLARVQ